MRVKPIIFSGPMVRAILDGRKTQTRRVLKVQPPEPCAFTGFYTVPETRTFQCRLQGKLMLYTQIVGFAPGDILYVREAHYLTDDGHEDHAVYSADDADVREHLAAIDQLPAYFSESLKAEHGKLRPSIHMPRWASRLTLEVTEVRVQRLQDISEADARAEGAPDDKILAFDDDAGHGEFWPEYRDWFADLWNSINEKRGFGWDANPWVCAVTFQPHQINVDEFLAQRRAPVQ